MAKKKYEAQHRICGLLDKGKELQLAETVVLEEADAVELVKCGALVLVVEKPPSKPVE